MRSLVPLAAAIALAGCSQTGLLAERTSVFAYPEPVEAAPVEVAPPAAPPAPVAPDPKVVGDTERDPAPYDMSKDPYVTSVLLPSVESDRSLQYEAIPDGKRTPPPPSPKLEVIDVHDIRAAMQEASP